MRRPAAVLVLAGLAIFWVALLVAGSLSPGYSHRRDYISSLAGRGVEHAWVGIVAIVAIALTGVGTALLVRPVSRAGALAFLGAGAGYIVVAFARIDCGNGAAACGLGGRFDVQGATQVTHWTAAVLATVLILAGLTLVGARLLRMHRRFAATLTFLAAAVTLFALVATGGQSPGTVQRLWVLVMTCWCIGSIALVTPGRVNGR
jgi:hypothetical protein